MPVEKSRAVKDEARTVDESSIAAANDDEARAAANDNEAAATVHRAANDNGTGIRVTDDLPRPLPVVRGEDEIVRKLLGERFRQILFGKQKL